MQWSHYTSPQSGLTFTHAHSKVPVEWQPWTGRRTGPHIRLCNFVQNISTNISALEKHTHLKLGELSSLFIVYNITIVWLHPLHSFWFFLLRDGRRCTHSLQRALCLSHIAGSAVESQHGRPFARTTCWKQIAVSSLHNTGLSPITVCCRY